MHFNSAPNFRFHITDTAASVGPKVAGSNPAEAVGFLRAIKNPQHVGGHGCLSVVIVVCCQVEVSATN